MCIRDSLRLGHFEPVAMAFPFRVRAGRTSQLQLLGPRVAQTLSLAASTPVGMTWVGGPAGSGGGRSLLPVQVVAGDVLVEREPNGSRRQAMTLPVGGRVSGRFGEPGDRDWYRISLKKGRKLQVVGNTASIGAAGRLYMRLVDAEGRTMVEVPPSVSTRTISSTPPVRTGTPGWLSRNCSDGEDRRLAISSSAGSPNAGSVCQPPASGCTRSRAAR